MSDWQTQHLLNEASRDMARREFSDFDHNSISKMSDKDLAAWHAEHASDSAQFILAHNEWNRRLVARQVNATKFSAFMGIAGIIIGVFLGWLLASYNPPYLANDHKQNPGQDSTRQHQWKNPNDVSPYPITEPSPK